MLKIVERIIEEKNHKIHNNEKEDSENVDVVDVLLRDNIESNSTPNSSLKRISENIIEMMIPGEETLPTAMTMAVKFLSDSPLALSKLLVRLLIILVY